MRTTKAKLPRLPRTKKELIQVVETVRALTSAELLPEVTPIKTAVELQLPEVTF
jgi:uncharacterized protein YqgV (UPF0045/DUF77 family)